MGKERKKKKKNCKFEFEGGEGCQLAAPGGAAAGAPRREFPVSQRTLVAALRLTWPPRHSPRLPELITVRNILFLPKY